MSVSSCILWQHWLSLMFGSMVQWPHKYFLSKQSVEFIRLWFLKVLLLLFLFFSWKKKKRECLPVWPRVTFGPSSPRAGVTGSFSLSLCVGKDRSVSPYEFTFLSTNARAVNLLSCWLTLWTCFTLRNWHLTWGNYDPFFPLTKQWPWICTCFIKVSALLCS